MALTHSRIIIITSLLLCLGLPGFSMAGTELVQLDDGRSIEVLYFDPADIDQNSGGNPPKLAVLMAAGWNNDYMAKAQYWVGRELVERGWAIAVPISPAGRRYFLDDAGLMPELIGKLYERHSLAGDKPLLLGISGGGSRALQLAVADPQAYAGVIAAPGRLDTDSSLPDLTGLNVMLRIGEKDNFRWNRLLPDIERRLLLAGATVDADLVEGGRHLLQLDWDELDSWLTTLESE